MNHDELVIKVQGIVSASRSTEYLVISDAFEELYELASETQRLLIQGWISNLEHEKLREWMRESIVDHEEMPVRELRKIARTYGIPDAHMMRKLELLGEIRNVLGIQK